MKPEMSFLVVNVVPIQTALTRSVHPSLSCYKCWLLTTPPYPEMNPD